MLNSIRNSLKFTKWILLLVIVSFVLFFGTSWWEGCGTTGGGDWVASVNGQVIRQAEWRQIARFLDSQYRQRLGENYELVRSQIDPSVQAREQLIDELLVTGDAERLGLRVADAELADRIRQHPAFQSAAGFVGSSEYKARVRRGAVPPFREVKSFEIYLRRQLLFLKWQSLIASSIALTDDEILSEFVRRNESVDMDYVAVGFEDFMSEDEPDSGTLSTWYQQNAADYAMGEARRAFFVLIDDVAVADRVEIPERDIERFFEENAEQFSRPEERRARHVLISVDPGADAATVDASRARAEDVFRRADGGEDFASLAEQESEDEGSRVQGGDLGFFARGRMVPEFENAVFDMSPGDVSGPIRSPFGFHVIRLEEIREEGRRELAEVRDQISSQLRFPRLREAAGELADSIVESLDSGTELADIAEDLDLAVRDTGLVSGGVGVPGLGPAPELVGALFALEQGERTEVMSLPLGKVVAVLDAVVSDHLPPLTSVRARVLQDYRSERAGESAADAAREAIRNGGDDLEAIASALSTGVETVTDWTRGRALAVVGADPAVERAVFTATVNEVVGPVEGTRSVVIAKVTYRKSADLSSIAVQRDQIELALKEPLVLEIIQRRVASLRESARIERNESLLEP